MEIVFCIGGQWSEWIEVNSPQNSQFLHISKQFIVILSEGLCTLLPITRYFLPMYILLHLMGDFGKLYSVM